ncbi:MAG TPA: HlyC/CorC family transporter [Candidatus Faecivivens stercorigallinarum]|nr:HlyC/CorC family transporter [Candidatus Faecivivens stercorigallinarum]
MISTLLSCYISAVLSAITHLSDVTLHDKAEDGDAKAVLLDRLMHGSFLDSVRTLSSFFGCVTTLVSGWLLYGVFYRLFEQLWEGIGVGLLRGATWLAAVLVISFCFIIVVRKIPGRLGKKYADRFAFSSVSTMYWLVRVFFPLCGIIRLVSRWIGRLFGIGREAENEQETVTEEDIRLMVDTGGEMGTIEKSQQEMIENIFEFDDNTAGDVMTHRTDVVAVEETATVADVASLAVETGFSRLPVYKKNLDNITGVIYVKDLLKLIADKSAIGEDLSAMPITGYIRPVIYVPESAGCRALFARFKATKTHIAVVVDEYGGTAGLVCMEDILESIVGDIEDEYDEQEEEVSRLKENEFMFDGTIDLKDAGELLEIEFPEDEDYDTLAGFITHMLGYIPDEGTTPYIDFSGWRFTVVIVDDRRIEKVRAAHTPFTPVAEESASEPEKDPETKDEKTDEKTA